MQQLFLQVLFEPHRRCRPREGRCSRGRKGAVGPRARRFRLAVVQWAVADCAVLASHHNSTLREEDPTAHAELKCIREGAKKLGSWQKLAETTLYVTLEPCPMCAGGILNARLGAVVWGAPNPLIGADGSWIDLMGDGGAAGCGAEGVCEAEAGEDEAEDDKNSATRASGFARGGGPLRPHAFKPSLAVRRRVLKEECGDVMRAFFKSRREAKRASREDARAKES